LEELKRRLAMHRRMFDAGIRMTVHSDAGARFTYFERFVDSVRIMVSGLGVRPMEAIQAATKHGASSLALHEEIGTVEPSKRADLLVLDRNPLENIENLGSIHHVLRGGKVLVDQGRLHPAWSAVAETEAQPGGAS